MRGAASTCGEAAAGSAASTDRGEAIDVSRLKDPALSLVSPSWDHTLSAAERNKVLFKDAVARSEDPGGRGYNNASG